MHDRESMSGQSLSHIRGILGELFDQYTSRRPEALEAAATEFDDFVKNSTIDDRTAYSIYALLDEFKTLLASVSILYVTNQADVEEQIIRQLASQHCEDYFYIEPVDAIDEKANKTTEEKIKEDLKKATAKNIANHAFTDMVSILANHYCGVQELSPTNYAQICERLGPQVVRRIQDMCNNNRYPNNVAVSNNAMSSHIPQAAGRICAALDRLTIPTAWPHIEEIIRNYFRDYGLLPTYIRQHPPDADGNVITVHLSFGIEVRFMLPVRDMDISTYMIRDMSVSPTQVPNNNPQFGIAITTSPGTAVGDTVISTTTDGANLSVFGLSENQINRARQMQEDNARLSARYDAILPPTNTIWRGESPGAGGARRS